MMRLLMVGVAVVATAGAAAVVATLAVLTALAPTDHEMRGW